MRLTWRWLGNGINERFEREILTVKGGGSLPTLFENWKLIRRTSVTLLPVRKLYHRHNQHSRHDILALSTNWHCQQTGRTCREDWSWLLPESTLPNKCSAASWRLWEDFWSTFDARNARTSCASHCMATWCLLWSYINRFIIIMITVYAPIQLLYVLLWHCCLLY